MQLEGCAGDNAADIRIGAQSWPFQCDFQGGGIGRIADEGVADGQGETIRRAADRHAETAITRPAMIDDQCAEDRTGNEERSDGVTPDFLSR